MRMIAFVAALLFASVANAGVIYQNGVDEHLNLRFLTDAQVEILPDQITLDILIPSTTTMVIENLVETTNFRVESISFTITSQAFTRIGYIGSIKGGSVSSEVYYGPAGTSEAFFQPSTDYWINNLEMEIKSGGYPNEVVLSNFVIMGDVYHLPEPPTMEMLIAIGALLIVASLHICTRRSDK